MLIELREAVETYKSKAESYLGRLEAAEIAKVKSARAEAFGASLKLPIWHIFNPSTISPPDPCRC